MAATIKPNGVIDFKRDSGLLSTASITREALKLLELSRKREEKFETYHKVAELRKSCGVEIPPLTIKRPESYHG